MCCCLDLCIVLLSLSHTYYNLKLLSVSLISYYTLHLLMPLFLPLICLCLLLYTVHCLDNAFSLHACLPKHNMLPSCLSLHFCTMDPAPHPTMGATGCWQPAMQTTTACAPWCHVPCLNLSSSPAMYMHASFVHLSWSASSLLLSSCSDATYHYLPHLFFYLLLSPLPYKSSYLSKSIMLILYRTSERASSRTNIPLLYTIPSHYFISFLFSVLSLHN